MDHVNPSAGDDTFGSATSVLNSFEEVRIFCSLFVGSDGPLSSVVSNLGVVSLSQITRFSAPNHSVDEW